MLVNVEKDFVLYLSNEPAGNDSVKCILHSFELFEKETQDQSGTMKITIGNREPFEFAIWGSTADHYSDCYVCLPTMLEDSEEDELEVFSLTDMLEGMIDDVEGFLESVPVAS